jgi:hypothetical protein
MTTEKHRGKEAEWTTGWKVFAALAVLSVLEVVATLTITNPMPWLTPLVLAKAALIIWYFMRLGDLRDKEAVE